MLVSRAEMTSLEADIFAHGPDPGGVIDAAGYFMAAELLAFWLRDRPHVAVFVGKGHNGGDALAVARRLHHAGMTVDVRLAHPPEKLAPLTKAMLARLPQNLPHRPLGEALERPPTWVLDGLLGLNATGPLRPVEREACREINALRQRGARVAALDLPSGVDADSGEAAEDAVLADLTLTVGFAKRGLVKDGATRHVGRLAVLHLPEFAAAAGRLGMNADETARGTLTDAAALAHLLPPREFDAHKGQFGRVGIFAGSVGFTGAAVLCARGALRGGAGLVSLFARRDIWPVIAAAAPAEAMVRPIADPREILDEKLDVLALGPGLGHKNAAAVLALVEKFPGPAVVDADALNLIAAGERRARRSSVVAPDRACSRRTPARCNACFPRRGHCPARRRRVASRTVTPARRFCSRARGRWWPRRAARWPIIPPVTPAWPLVAWVNVLTGVLGALLGQKLAPFDAARLGAWLCGRAAERARREGRQSEQSLLPGDLFAQLGGAWEELRAAG